MPYNVFLCTNGKAVYIQKEERFSIVKLGKVHYIMVLKPILYNIERKDTRCLRNNLMHQKIKMSVQEKNTLFPIST